MVTGAFGLLFHALVWLTGSLYVAIIVHIAVNVTIGLASGVHGRRVGYGLPSPEASQGVWCDL
jgi:membrane protease YdiL (CAAX protease family)